MGLSQDAELTMADQTVNDQLPVLENNSFEARNLVSFQQTALNLNLQQLQLQRIRAGYMPSLSRTASY